MDSINHAFFAPCPRGLEGVLADELKDLGASDIEATAGGVAFRGALALCYRVNLQSRIASRILLRIAEPPITTSMMSMTRRRRFVGRIGLPRNRLSR